MTGPIEPLALVGPCVPHHRSVHRASIAASIAGWPRAVATQVIGLIVLSIAAILAVVPSALGMVLGFHFLIFDRLGIA
jgi:hypothetical protein